MRLVLMVHEYMFACVVTLALAAFSPFSLLVLYVNFLSYKVIIVFSLSSAFSLSSIHYRV